MKNNPKTLEEQGIIATTLFIIAVTHLIATEEINNNKEEIKGITQQVLANIRGYTDDYKTIMKIFHEEYNGN